VSAIPKRQRLLDRVMVATTLVAAVAVPVLGYTGARAVLDSTGGRDARGDNLPVQTFPATPAAAWFITDDDGELSALAVLVLDPSRQGGSLVDLPVNADTGLGPDDRRGLHEVFAEEGLESAMLAVESLTAVSLAFGFEAGVEELAAVLAPLGPLDVDLVVDADVAGSAAPLADGRAVLDPATAAAVLTEPAATSAGGFDGHRQNVNAVWTAVAAANGDGSRPTVEDPALPVDQAEYLDRFFAGAIGARPIATNPIDDDPSTSSTTTTTAPLATTSTTDDTVAGATSTTIDGGEPTSSADELVAVDRADAVFVFASIAPGSMSGPASGLLFRLEAPPGYDAQVKYTVTFFLFLGGNVVSVDTGVEAQPDTVFVVPDEVNRGKAQIADAFFGNYSFVDPTFRIDGVDITIVLGTEYLESVDV
jgi:hypothetical protein